MSFWTKPEYGVEVIAKRRKDRPEDAMARWMDKEWAQDRIEHIRKRDKDGRNPFA